MPASWKLWLHCVDEHQADLANLYESWFEDWVADSDRYGAIADFHEYHYRDNINWSQDRGKIVETLILNRASGRSRDVQRRPPILAEAEAHVTDNAAVTDAAPNAEVTSTTPCVAAPTEGIVEVSLSDEDADVGNEESAATTAAVPDKDDASVPEHSGSLALASAMRSWPQRRYSVPAHHPAKNAPLAAKNKRKNVPLAARLCRCSPSSEAATEHNKKDHVLKRDRRPLAQIKTNAAKWDPAKQRQFYAKLVLKHRDIKARKEVIIQIAKRQQESAQHERDEHERGLRERCFQELGLRDSAQHRSPYAHAPWHCSPWQPHPIYLEER